jgi:hypothetical protein
LKLYTDFFTDVKKAQHNKIRSKNPSVKFSDLFENQFDNCYYDFKIIRKVFKEYFQIEIEILDDMEE